MKDYRPRIGITMRLETETDRFYLGRHYSEAVEAAGGIPLHISLIPNHDYLNTVLDDLHGVLLPGSDSDVDPLRYGQEPHQRLGFVQPVKDDTDLIVLGEIEARAIPLFGICFGMQVLNVSRNGTLIQDIEAQLPNAIKHEQGTPRDRPSHRVKFSEGSLLRALSNSDTAVVNSHHHQAIETIGDNLIATAWTADGLVEGVEDSRPDRFALAVQWHPELGWENDPLSQSLFGRFINEARKYSERSAEKYAAESHS